MTSALVHTDAAHEMKLSIGRVFVKYIQDAVRLISKHNALISQYPKAVPDPDAHTHIGHVLLGAVKLSA